VAEKAQTGSAENKTATRKIDNLIAIGNRTAHIEPPSRICKGNNLVVGTSDEQFDSIHYIGMSIYKIVFFCLTWCRSLFYGSSAEDGCSWWRMPNMQSRSNVCGAWTTPWHRRTCRPCLLRRSASARR